jgi:hypothetical protein
MGTEEGMGKTPASSVGSDDVLQVESTGKWPYLLRCEPWRPGHQGTAALGPGLRAFFYFILFFWSEFIFFKAWMRLIFLMSHFQVSQDFDESFSSLSRLG